MPSSRLMRGSPLLIRGVLGVGGRVAAAALIPWDGAPTLIPQEGWISSAFGVLVMLTLLEPSAFITQMSLSVPPAGIPS